MPDPQAIELIYNQISALPDPEFGRINILPFASDTPETNAIKLRVAQAICTVFEEGGYPLTSTDSPRRPVRTVTIRCSSCSTVLLTVPAEDGGTAIAPGMSMITQLSQLNPQCPHKLITLEDQRRRIEEALSHDG